MPCKRVNTTEILFLEEKLRKWKRRRPHGDEMGHKMPSIAGVKGTVGLIFPAADSVASMLSTCWHFSIWPCHRLARAGVHHFHAGRACEYLHRIGNNKAASDKKTPTRPRNKDSADQSWSVINEIKVSFLTSERKTNLKMVAAKTSETPANQGIQSDSVSSG